MKLLILTILLVGSSFNLQAEVSNIVYHEFSKVSTYAYKNGQAVELKEVLSPRSPLRAKSEPWNCQDNNGMRNKSGKVFIGSPDYDVLPLTYTFDFDYWTVDCDSEGSTFYIALQQPSPNELRKKDYKVNNYYETIHNINPEKVIQLPELQDLLGKTAKAEYECRLYNLKIDNDGVFYGCVQKTKSSTVVDGQNLLKLKINVLEGQAPVNVAKRYPKFNTAADGKVESVTLYPSKSEARGVNLNSKVKPVTIPYSEYLKRAITIDNEEYVLTD